jgi:hypothetical protein
LGGRRERTEEKRGRKRVRDNREIGWIVIMYLRIGTVGELF